MLKDVKNVNGWASILDSDDSTIEIVDADYEDIASLHREMLLILYDVENMLKIVDYKMYLKYTTGGRNVKKNISSLK